MRRALIALLLVGGCIDPQRTFDSVFPRYQDRPVEALMVRWGPPEQALKVDGGTIYTWKSTSTASFVDSGTAVGTIGNTPVVMQTPVASSVSGSCRAEAHVNARGNVIGIRYRGPNGPCDVMLERLR